MWLNVLLFDHVSWILCYGHHYHNHQSVTVHFLSKWLYSSFHTKKWSEVHTNITSRQSPMEVGRECGTSIARNLTYLSRVINIYLQTCFNSKAKRLMTFAILLQSLILIILVLITIQNNKTDSFITPHYHTNLTKTNQHFTNINMNTICNSKCSL